MCGGELQMETAENFSASWSIEGRMLDSVGLGHLATYINEQEVDG